VFNRTASYTFLTSTEKPPELTMLDQLRQLAEQGDLTSAAIRYAQLAAEEEYRYQPATLAGIVAGVETNSKSPH